jgi:regulatory protein
MTIDAIREQKRNKERVNIYAGNEFIGALNTETAVKYGLKVGAEIADGFFAEIVKADNEKYAFDKALQYIAYARRTEGEVKKHLASKGIAEDAVENAIEKLKGYRYIDDAEYARQYAAEMMREKNMGLKALAFKLRQKGVSGYDIEDVLSEWGGEDEMQNALSLYQALSLKYAKDDEGKRRQKIIRAMAAKGFEYETIQGILNRKGE